MAHRNVYMGKDSTAKITTKGKVDTCKEILRCIYALAYDIYNGYLLTRRYGVFKSVNWQTVRGRYFVLERLAEQYCKTLLKLIEIYIELFKAFYKGLISSDQYLQKIRSYARRYGLSDSEIKTIENKIKIAERVGKMIQARKNKSKSKKGRKR